MILTDFKKNLKRAFSITAMAAALLCIPAAPALAQDDWEWDDDDEESSGPSMAAGMEVQANIVAPMAITGDDGVAQTGFGLHFKFGYRWAHAAFFIEEDLDTLWELRDGRGDHAEYVGATYAVINETGPLSDHSRLFFDIGLGVMYGTRGALPRSSAYAAFSLKVAAGYAYAFNDALALRISVDYAMAAVEKSKRIDDAPNGVLHFLQPQIGISYTF